MKNSYLCIIPARGGSKTIKNKNLSKINNLTLIGRTIEVALKTKIFDEIIVSSDSNQILKLTKRYGVIAHKRSKINARDVSSTHDVILEIIDNEIVNFTKKNIVILQPTSPFRTEKHIKKAINKFDSHKYADSLVSVQLCSHNMIPESLMKLSKNYLIFNQKNKLFRKQDKPVYYARNGAATYITHHKRIKNYILGGKIIHFEMNKIESLDIDDLEDLKLAQLLATKYIL